MLPSAWREPLPSLQTIKLRFPLGRSAISAAYISLPGSPTRAPPRCMASRTRIGGARSTTSATPFSIRQSTGPKSLAGTFSTQAGLLPRACRPSDTSGCSARALFQGQPECLCPQSVLRLERPTSRDEGPNGSTEDGVNPAGIPILRRGQVIGGIGVAGVSSDRAEFAEPLPRAPPAEASSFQFLPTPWRGVHRRHPLAVFPNLHLNRVHPRGPGPATARIGRGLVRPRPRASSILLSESCGKAGARGVRCDWPSGRAYDPTG